MKILLNFRKRYKFSFYFLLPLPATPCLGTEARAELILYQGFNTELHVCTCKINCQSNKN